MVEGADQPDVAREQHAVAEHVARHVADADDREVLDLDVLPELAEVALHGLPRAARRDPHLLVVVAGRAAGGEGVAEPEPLLDGDAVGDVRERRGALVGRHDQVGVVAVVAHDARGRRDLASLDVVREVEEAADEGLVAGHDLLGEVLATRRRALHDEAALGPDRHDHGVLHHLGLHQAEHLGAEVLAPVRPADAAARHRPAAQVHALGAGRVDEDLEARARLWQPAERGRVELEREVARPPRWGRSGSSSCAGSTGSPPGTCGGSGPGRGSRPRRSPRRSARRSHRRPRGRCGAGRSAPGTAPPGAARSPGAPRAPARRSCR